MTESANRSNKKKVALISAGASGIGRCIAELLLKQDFNVHVFDISAEAVEQFLSDNPIATASIADISNPDAVKQVFVEFSQHYEHLDLLVNNAGIAGPTAPVEDIDPEDWKKTIDVDLNGNFYCTRLAVPLLKANGKGSIVNIASNAALFGFPLRSAYTAAKWAMIGLTKTWAMELGPFNIRVNAICPGSVQGDRIERVIAKDAAERGVDVESIRSKYVEQNSLRRFTEAEEIAQMVQYLSSDFADCISGQSIAIDGHTESLSNNL